MKTKYIIPNGKELRIAISGKSGCGNTTVSTLLAEKLNLPCINYTFKNLAKEMDISFEEIVQRAKTDFSFDKIVDRKQIELAEKQSCVLGSRLAIWLLKKADVRIYLKASAEKRVERIFAREGGVFEDLKIFTIERDAEDSRRYKELYNIDNENYRFADIIVNAENMLPNAIVSMIIEYLAEKNLIVVAPSAP